MHSLLRARGAGALLAAAAVAAGGAASASAANPFYTPPATLPDGPGQLVKSESMKIGVNISTPNGTATRIMYTSVDTNGNAVPVTGTYIEPKGEWKGAGSRPLITYAEGTQGQGDRCAPSYGLENAIGSSNGQTNIGYEVPNIAGLVNRGFAVVVTDYIGLGTPGVHTYVNRVDEGHAVLDAARVALKVPGATVSADSPVGAYGYSQGGGATASAAELAPTYAPDVNLKAVYAGAPPADLNAVMKTADGTTLTGVIGYAVNGFLATYPSLQAQLNVFTNQAGRNALKKIANQCIGDSVGSWAFQKTSSWTTTKTSIYTIAQSNPEIKAVVDAQRIGTLKPEVPVRIITGTLDDIVTHSQVKQLALDWCALGAPVSYSPIKQFIPTGGSSLNHLGPSLTEGNASQAWIAARLAGTPEASNCSRVARLP